MKGTAPQGKHPGDDQLITYALDELEAPERAQVESHLAQCKDCSGVVTALTSAIQSLRKPSRSDAPAGILVNLLEAQAASCARTPSRWWRLGPAAAFASAAVMAVLFLTGFWTGRQTAPTSLSPPPSAGNGAEIHYPLPEPPDIPFQTALAAVQSQGTEESERP